ncbi:MAG: hypothetical protein ACKPKO_16180, partial [Candidatus Fonsibacter sp.]
NGFGYTNELLMQRHNFSINHCWELLTNEGVNVHTTKTDGFTIQQSQLDCARELMNWEDGIGSWRLNKTEDIKFPMDESLLTLRNKRLVEIAAPKTTHI